MSITSNADDVTPHIWVGGFGSPHDRYPKNILAFAERHNMAIVLSCWDTSPESVEGLEADLEVAADYDVDVWLGTYDLREHSDQELVGDDAKLQQDIERLERTVDAYAKYHSDGNVFLWHEAPLTGQWTGETRSEQAESMRRYGPSLFAAQKRALAERHPDVDVGLMLHFPYLAPEKHSERPVLEPLMDQLRQRGAVPDFTYFDFYRRHVEWSSGYDASNELLESTIKNIRANMSDRPIYYLGEAHTANNNYTPSKQAVLGNLRTALEAGVDGYGWLDRKGFRETSDRNYDPFVPNIGSPDVDGQFRTSMGARDRFRWACLLLFERVLDRRDDDLFDLWVHGSDLNFYEFAVYLRNREGEWEFVGDVSGYHDGDTPYSGGSRDRVCAFSALERDRYLTDDKLELRIEPTDGATDSELHGVYAVPHLDAAQYVTEPDLTGFCADADPGAHSLAAVTPSTDLSADGEFRTSFDVSQPESTLTDDPVTGHVDRTQRQNLREREATTPPHGLFDLWVYGRDLAIDTEVGGKDIKRYGDPAAGTDGDVQAVVYRGLERFEFFEVHTSGHVLPISITARDDAELYGVFAMPYRSAETAYSAAEVARLVDREYTDRQGEVATFGLAHRTWPRGLQLEEGEVARTHLQYYPRTVSDAALEFDGGDV
jgi:hypothetical protein